MPEVAGSNPAVVCEETMGLHDVTQQLIVPKAVEELIEYSIGQLQQPISLRAAFFRV